LGLTNAPLIVAQTLQKSQIGIARISCGPDSIGMTPRVPAEDTFIAAVYLTDVPHHELWSRGKRVLAQPYAANSMRIVNLEAEFSARIACEHETVAFHIPRRVLDEFAHESGGRVRNLTCQPGVQDPVIASLVQALLPAFDNPHGLSALFVDHVSTAVLLHLAGQYGNLQLDRRPTDQGRLSLIQERRAKECLAANLDGKISLAEIAKTCGQSRGYFIGAFARTTGLTPYKWLLIHRLQKASAMLLESSLSIAEVALICGFADQSHMTRHFTRHFGNSPAAWRRAHRGTPIDTFWQNHPHQAS
jgi:AraC-like DNA-binding protein